MTKDNDADVAAAREPKPTTCDVSTANAVDNASPADVASVAEAVVAAGVVPPAGAADVPDVFAVAKDEFSDVAAAAEPVATADVVSAADDVATASPEDDAAATKNLATVTAAPPAGAVEAIDTVPAPGAGCSPAGTAAPPPLPPTSTSIGCGIAPSKIATASGSIRAAPQRRRTAPR